MLGTGDGRITGAGVLKQAVPIGLDDDGRVGRQLSTIAGGGCRQILQVTLEPRWSGQRALVPRFGADWEKLILCLSRPKVYIWRRGGMR